jgi:two-component system alkaline phosphatase synthesis response regulator PhoP
MQPERFAMAPLGRPASVTPARRRGVDGQMAVLVVFLHPSRACECVAALERAGFAQVAGPFSGASTAERRLELAGAPATAPSPRSRECHRFGDVLVDVEARDVLRAGERVKLTAAEFDLLVTLARAAGAVVSTAKMQRVLGRSRRPGNGTQALRMHIVHLRHKLEHDPKHPRHLLTIWGRGYRLANARRAHDVAPSGGVASR